VLDLKRRAGAAFLSNAQRSRLTVWLTNDCSPPETTWDAALCLQRAGSKWQGGPSACWAFAARDSAPACHGWLAGSQLRVFSRGVLAVQHWQTWSLFGLAAHPS
jgi:hypothetical protein